MRVWFEPSDVGRHVLERRWRVVAVEADTARLLDEEKRISFRVDNPWPLDARDRVLEGEARVHDASQLGRRLQLVLERDDHGLLRT